MLQGPASQANDRERDLAELIRRAQENPGVREMMEVYARAQEAVTHARSYLRIAEHSVQSVSDRTSG